MCTVTYIPLKNNEFIFTSNRDETPLRKTISPAKHIYNGVTLWYPKDKLAGGTWIGVSSEKRLVCLLNGGFKKHQRKSSYKTSRGIIVKEILATPNAISFIENFDFNDIEPFTIVLVNWKQQLEAYELVWDGTKKHFKKLAQKPQIWSSSTLYTPEDKELRQQWFAKWLKETKTFDTSTVLNFHKNTEKGTVENSLKMKREFVETVSITSIRKEKEKIDILYKDFVNDSISSLVID